MTIPFIRLMTIPFIRLMTIPFIRLITKIWKMFTTALEVRDLKLYERCVT
jgi:hypothetical protein